MSSSCMNMMETPYSSINNTTQTDATQYMLAQFIQSVEPPSSAICIQHQETCKCVHRKKECICHTQFRCSTEHCSPDICMTWKITIAQGFTDTELTEEETTIAQQLPWHQVLSCSMHEWRYMALLHKHNHLCAWYHDKCQHMAPFSGRVK